MASKTFLLLGLSFAIVLLIASEVAANDLTEAATTSTTVSVDKSKDAEVEDKNAVKDAKYDQGYRGYPGGGYGGYPGGGYGGGPNGGYGGYPGGGYGGRGGYGGGGRGRGCYYGYCGYRCCNAAEAQAQEQPQN